MNDFEMRKLLADFHNLTDIDSAWTFYYDESNNHRKFRLKQTDIDTRFNVSEDEDFVLGGVMYTGNTSISDVDSLLEQLKLQETVKELKFKYIACGDFIQCLSSDKLHSFLKWLLASDLYVHYSNINILYFSIVDIVDSLIVDVGVKELNFVFLNEMKDILYQIVLNEKKEFVNLLYKYGYPNLKTSRIEDFIDSLILILEKYEDTPKFHVWVTSIKQMLKQAKRGTKLSFIMNNQDYILISDFSAFYLRPFMLFVNSTHIFDNESEIQKIITEFATTSNESYNYKFVDSTADKYIQISDVFIGLLGKCFTFINKNTINQLITTIDDLNALQRENLSLLGAIINKSNDKSRALLHSSSSNFERRKLNFLFGWTD
ncbi:hypothetical protein M3650_24050 [Paenibacillus sp. MER TA 81-3]|nr:hypothetical protein [Paenibacillus sp. MER TA 81-3]